MSMEDQALELAKALINIESITPNDNGCQKMLADRLSNIGFSITDIPSNGVSNFWAQHSQAKPLFTFSGHTDVVPPGLIKRWKTEPFTATEANGYLYGRGAADMKSALAAMTVATEQFITDHPDYNGSIGFMITSDEEGDATDGTIKIVDYLSEHNIKPNWCLIGEASSLEQLGDVIKIGRRGSMHGNLQVIGKQGHIAYPQQAENPIHRCFKALDSLTNTQWDKGNEHFTPTSFQIYNINADTGATNVIPGALTASFNFRFAPTSSAQELQEKVHKTLDDHELHYKLNWNLMSEPFLSQPGDLRQSCVDLIKSHCQIDTHPNTTGGTSDGRFIHKLGCEIVELGPVSKCIHQTNEHINIDDLKQLTRLYYALLCKLLAQ